MYNRILKRPMFRRGGSSFQSQGTGITSPYDTPRRGLVQYPGGYAGEDETQPDTIEQIDIERKEIFEPKKGQWLNDVIGSFGAYGNPYKESGEAKTIGEMGYEQATEIQKIRDLRKEKEDLAALSGLESREKNLIRIQEQEYKKELERMRGENLEFKQQIKNERKRADDKIAALDKTDPKYDEKVADIEAEFNNISRQIVRGTPGMTELIQNAKDRLYKIHSDSIKATGSSYLQTLVEQWNAKNPTKTKTITDIIQEQAVADVAGTTAAASILIQQNARGGRVGYQFGTPNTGAAPVQQASLTETIDTPTADITETETVTEGQQSSVQMPYQEFRAAIPAEVSDEIVQLIYYNQDAFADFSQITTQADVYAFNNKYGVSLVLPMDTETT
jgi:gas vesicle protein